jgi:cystathionine beta-lyase
MNGIILFLCNPHNPVGRSWSPKELELLYDVCRKNNIIVFSDEIHSDLVYAPSKHTVFASINDKAKDITVSAFGVGKSFNLAGMSISTVVITQKRLKIKFMEVYNKIHFALGSTLSHVAFTSAYTHGDIWLQELKTHLWQNFVVLEKLCEKYPQYIKITPIQATYLAWLDCRGIGKNSKQIEQFFIHKAKLGLTRGIFFSKAGSGFMRLNFAVSSVAMKKIIKQLDTALSELTQTTNI